MTTSQFHKRDVTAWRLARKAGRLLALLGWLLGSNQGAFGDAPSLTEYQVKALFLLNFTKYVDWPASAFPQADSPITIGVVGENNFGEDLGKAVEGKIVGGRKIILVPANDESEWSKCRILFVSASEKKRLPEILAAVKTQAVLTVGETEQFTALGGVINFTKREGRIRLEISLDGARLARIQVSSKLLSVADAVRGGRGANP